MTAPGREEPARKKPIHLLLLEDNGVFRAGLAAILRTHREMRVLDGPARISQRSRKWHPTIILFDVELEGGRSVEIVRKARAEYPDARFLGMGMTPATAEILRLVREGVSGFILKDAPVEGFVEAIRAVTEGKTVLPPILAGPLFTQITANDGRAPSARGSTNVVLTRREQEIVTCIAEGMTNKEIGERLHIAPETVKSHVHHLLEKLGLRGRVELATHARTLLTPQGEATAGNFIIDEHGRGAENR